MIDPMGRAINSTIASIDGSMKARNHLCGTSDGSRRTGVE